MIQFPHVVRNITDLTGTEIPFVGLDLRRLLSDSLSPFYRYHGSLTTPPCYESVIWTICETVQTLSQKQVKALIAQKSISWPSNSHHARTGSNPSIHPLIHIPTHSPTYLSTHSSIYQFIYPSIHILIYPSICSFIHHSSTHSLNHPSNTYAYII